MGCFTLVEVMKMILPHRRARMPGSAARASRTALRRVRGIARVHSSSPRPAAGPGGGPPQLATSTSTRENRSSAAAMKRRGPSSVARSAATARAGGGAEPLPAAARRACSSMASAAARILRSSRDETTTDMPSPARARATALPRPLEAAATAATFPWSPSSIALLPSRIRVPRYPGIVAKMIIAVAGDLHGALDALYQRIGAWEARSGRAIELVLQCGDLGAFAPDAPLDRATRKRLEKDPSELGAREYLTGEKRASHQTWFVRGNHEDFALLAAHPDGPIDPAGRIRHLSGG